MVNNVNISIDQHLISAAVALRNLQSPSWPIYMYVLNCKGRISGGSDYRIRSSDAQSVSESAAARPMAHRPRRRATMTDDRRAAVTLHVRLPDAVRASCTAVPPVSRIYRRNLNPEPPVASPPSPPDHVLGRRP